MIWELFCFLFSCLVCVVLTSACCSPASRPCLSLSAFPKPVFHALRQRSPFSLLAQHDTASRPARSSSSSSSSTPDDMMAATGPSNGPLHDKPLPTICRTSSPSPDAVPTPAIGGPGVASQNTTSGDFSRCFSTASSLSHGSATTDGLSVRRESRDSLGSDASSSFSRQSSGAYSATSSSLSAASSSSRLSSMASFDRGSVLGNHSNKRRGYMRPQGTNFSASARSRESVLSLGSIAHLQHYFARTGLLDIKGNLERKRQGKSQTQGLGHLDTSSQIPPRSVSMTGVPSSGGSRTVSGAGSVTSGVSATSSSDADSSYTSTGSGPDLDVTTASHTSLGDGVLVESPIREEHSDEDEGEWYVDDMEDPDPSVLLPPTVSTYIVREKPLPKPPSLSELKEDLRSSLDDATNALNQVQETKLEHAQDGLLPQGSNNGSASPSTPKGASSWFEIQGMHILDVMTLAIRAAKMYYTSHESPDRLDTIKSEREVRSELLAVMDVLKRMAARSFAGGIRDEEVDAMQAWITGLNAMLEAEEAMAAAERRKRNSWTWLRDEDWPQIGADVRSPSQLSEDKQAGAYEREYAFLQSMLAVPAVSSSAEEKAVLAGSDELPVWTPMDRDPKTPLASNDHNSTSAATSPAAPTPFLQHMQNGVQLVQLHNCAVRQSKRRFGAIPSFHSDTQKPYRAAENLRYWVKAAELRWEVPLKIDALAVVCNSRPEAWAEFEDAIWQWCRKVRAEIASEVVAA